MVGERVAAGRVAGSAAVASRHERSLLAVRLAERGVLAVVQIKDVVSGDGEVWVGGEGERPQVVVVAAEGGVGEVQQDAVGEEVEEAVGVGSNGEEEGGGVDAGERESRIGERGAGGVEVEGERDEEAAALGVGEEEWGVEKEEAAPPARRRHGGGMNE